jgi:hypothetical protein
VWVCRCTVCGTQVRGQHPEVATDPAGTTVYQIRPRHRHVEVQEVIPPDDAGVMVTDRGRSSELIEPTNHRAEQALGPAVIARKVSQCSKTGRGAQAFAALTRVVRTLAHSGIASVVEGLYHLFRSPNGQLLLPDPYALSASLINYRR